MAESLRVLFCLLLTLVPVAGQERRLVVGSKNFPESMILAELMAQMIESRTPLQVERRFGLGGTLICWNALREGEIDLYADYTGTGWAVLLRQQGELKEPLRAWFEVARRSRVEHDVIWMAPFGFNNTYVLAMPEARAQALGVRRISDLAAHRGELRAGFSIEFMERADGYPGLDAAYDLRLTRARGLEHSLAYEGLRAGQLDLIDAYATDARLLQGRLRLLEDDRGFFPPYHAAPLVRGATLRAHPELRQALESLAFCLDERQMQRLNHQVVVGKQEIAVVCRGFLVAAGLLEGGAAGELVDAAVWPRRLWQILAELWQHLWLTLVAVVAACAVALPLGILASRRPRLGGWLLGMAGVLQTIPGLALLAFTIPVLGLGVPAALAALFVYALLPILRNTCTGIQEVDASLVDAARGIGLTERQSLRYVELPLAFPTIMAGIRTASVISVGVATLAAFVGAGGLGQFIIQGLYLNDSELILCGAVPAALLAVGMDAALARAVARRPLPARP